MRKSILMVGLALVAGVVVAEKTLIKEEAASGRLELDGGAKIVELKDGTKVFEAEKQKGIVSRKKFAIDSSKSYLVSVKIKAVGDTPSLAHLGVMPYDDQGRYIDSHNAKTVRDSQTELVAACEPDAVVLVVKDCSKWSKSPSTVVAFDVREDESDLPNFNVSASIKGIEKRDDVFELTLTKPVGKAYSAGTKIRQHVMGGYVYAKSGAVPNEWTLWKGVINGQQLRRGTTGRLILLCNWGKHREQTILFDELSIKEHKAGLADINSELQSGYMRQWLDITRGENVALGKTITSSMAPNYPHAPNNRLENLLDGKVSMREDGKLLFAPEAFAIAGGGIIDNGLQLVVDLHQVYPIRTIAMRVMGGGATVSQQVPGRITVLASADGIEFYEVDTFHKLGLDESGAANGKNLFYLEETGENFVFPIRFTDLRIKARYIVFQISSARSFVSDEIAVIKGDFDIGEVEFQPEAKRIFIREGIGLYPDKNVLAVSSNVITPNFFKRVDMRKEKDSKRETTYCFELPSYLEIMQASPRLKIISVEPLDSGRKKWSFRGMEYSRGDAVGPVYLKVVGEPDGKGDTAVLYV